MRLIQFTLASLLCFSSMNAYYAERKNEGIIKLEHSEFLSLIKTLIPEEPVIMEAGGHYGVDTVKFAALWPRAKIISFEPNPSAYSKLSDAVRGMENVRTVPIALSNYDGEAVLHVCYGTTGDNPIFEGASSLLEASDYMAIHYQGPQVTVPCRILDHWCEENNVQNIDFMWLDMEGMEFQVLQSSPNILKTVKVISCETNFQEFRRGMTQYTQIKNFLEGVGFIELCHSYLEGIQGDALFVRQP